MPKTPSYRKRKGYTQALVTLTDSRTRKRRDFWLGEYGTPASREHYHRIIAAWEAHDRRWPEPEAPGGGDRADDPASATVTMIIDRYWQWAEQYYQRNESGTLRVVLRLLREHYGTTPAIDFGPKKLRHLREAMIVGDPDAEPQAAGAG